MYAYNCDIVCLGMTLGLADNARGGQPVTLSRVGKIRGDWGPLTSNTSNICWRAVRRVPCACGLGMFEIRINLKTVLFRLIETQSEEIFFQNRLLNRILSWDLSYHSTTILHFFDQACLIPYLVRYQKRSKFGGSLNAVVVFSAKRTS